MESDKFGLITEASREIDSKFAETSPDELGKFSLVFTVPSGNNHRNAISSYIYHTGRVEDINLEDSFVICDEYLKGTFAASVLNGQNVVYLKSSESNTKEISLIDKFIEDYKTDIIGSSTIIAMGGGLIINVAAYIAEKLGKSIINVPTTIIAIADGSIGGKVRANKIDNGAYFKHFYKSFYEPNEILVDLRFLDSLSDEGIKTGLAEIVKHAIYQSHALLEYLNSDDFNPFANKKSLWKAIAWAVALKKVCLDIDPEETPEGSNMVLRAAHDLSDELEEQSNLTLPHGKAVAIAMWRDLSENGRLNKSIEDVYSKIGLARTLEDVKAI